jgi:hypothetical protein
MLSILTLILTFCIGTYYVAVFFFPQSAFNPLKPDATALSIFPTPTLIPIQLEPTWTVTPTLVVSETPTLLPTYTLEPSATPFSLITPTNTFTSIFTPTTQPEIPTSTLTIQPENPTATLATQFETPNPTQTLQAAFSDVDSQFENSLKGNIAFNKPEQMKKDEATSIELILSPSLSQPVLATQLVDQGGFVTSTAEPNVLIAPNGETVTVTTSQIEITPRMKAVLLPQDPEAFAVTEMHDNAEQVVSSVETTAWRWSVTAKKEGSQMLELVIYQLVKYDGKEFWHEVETYKADIVVEVTLGDRVKSLDWYWIAGFIVTLVGAVLGVLKWLDERKKKPGVMQVKIVEKKSPPKRKK